MKLNEMEERLYHNEYKIFQPFNNRNNTRESLGIISIVSTSVTLSPTVAGIIVVPIDSEVGCTIGFVVEFFTSWLKKI